MRCVLCRSLEVAMVIPPLSYDYGRESLAICERCNQILHGRSRDYFRRPYVVYALINPFKTDGGGIFYIGKAKNRYGSRKGNIRLQHHLTDAKDARRDGYINPRNRMILEIVDGGRRPIYRVLEYYDTEREAYLGEMDKIREIGLENLTDRKSVV